MNLITLTKDNFDQVIADNSMVIIDFWADWCGPCKSFLPIYTQVAENNSKVAFTKVNIDEETELADAFQVRSIPQLVVMKQQVVIFSESGVLPASALQDLVDQAEALDLSDFHEQVRQAEEKQDK